MQWWISRVVISLATILIVNRSGMAGTILQR